MTDRTIPLPLIPVIAEALKDTYTESKLRGLFAVAGIQVAAGAKMTKVELCMTCLGWANQHLRDPLTTLGGIIGDLMDREIAPGDPLVEHQKRVAAALTNSQYKYGRGGQITPDGARAIANLFRSMAPVTPVSKIASPGVSTGALVPSSESTNTLVVGRANAVDVEVRARPTLFVGSTVEALSISRAVHEELDHDLEVTLWNHGQFPAGASTWSQLHKVTGTFDFALFVFTGDDHIESRGEESISVRDNVLIEFGLFVGALGHDRVFFMYNRDARPKIASDLAGVTPLTYAERADKNLQAAVSPACEKIRQASKSMGRRSVAKLGAP